MSKTALLIIDMQNDYFPNGAFTLNGIEAAAVNARHVLDRFREQANTIVHVRHEFASSEAPFFVPDSEGAKIHETLWPQEGEHQVLKHEVNSFKGTDLHALLQKEGITQLVIVGAMSHICIDAVTRAAADLGYSNTVLHDACATLDVSFNGVTVPAAHVHATIMAALEFAYADVISTDAFLQGQ